MQLSENKVRKSAYPMVDHKSTVRTSSDIEWKSKVAHSIVASLLTLHIGGRNCVSP